MAQAAKEVDQATNELHLDSDWGANMEIIDKIKTDPEQ